MSHDADLTTDTTAPAPVPAYIEPLTMTPAEAEAAHADKAAEHHHQYIFARLRRRLPPPSSRRLVAVTYVAAHEDKGLTEARR